MRQGLKVYNVIGALAMTGLLSACGSDQGATVPPPNPADNDLLWQAHHPDGLALQVQLASRDQPSTVIIKDDHAYLGDDIIGDVRGNNVVGLDNSVILHLDGSAGVQPLGTGITNSGLKWSGSVIPYVFDGSATTNIRNQFNQAVNIYNTQTVLRWVSRTNQANYVRVKADNGCYSYVGMMSTSFKPNGQELALGTDGCGVGGALHEMGHASGLQHEMIRQDRDQHITVNYNVIPSQWRSQFDINRDNGSNSSFTPYDYHSIMHYRNVNHNGTWEMVSKEGVAPQDIGTNSGYLTDLDKQSFAIIYGAGGGSGISLVTGQWKSLQVTTPGFTDRFLRHFNSLGFTEIVNAGSDPTLKADATFRVVAALDGTGCYSLESRNFPGKYLRHAGFRLRIDANNNTDTMHKDATFCAQTGLANGSGVSLVSRNYPGYYIRHRNSEVWLDQNDNSAGFKQDASWNLASPWTP